MIFFSAADAALDSCILTLKGAHAKGREKDCRQFQSIAACIILCCALRIQAINWYLNSSSACVFSCRKFADNMPVENLYTKRYQHIA